MIESHLILLRQGVFTTAEMSSPDLLVTGGHRFAKFPGGNRELKQTNAGDWLHHWQQLRDMELTYTKKTKIVMNSNSPVYDECFFFVRVLFFSVIACCMFFISMCLGNTLQSSFQCDLVESQMKTNTMAFQHLSNNFKSEKKKVPQTVSGVLLWMAA